MTQRFVVAPIIMNYHRIEPLQSNNIKKYTLQCHFSSYIFLVLYIRDVIPIFRKEGIKSFSLGVIVECRLPVLKTPPFRS